MCKNKNCTKLFSAFTGFNIYFQSQSFVCNCIHQIKNSKKHLRYIQKSKMDQRNCMSLLCLLWGESLRYNKLLNYPSGPSAHLTVLMQNQLNVSALINVSIKNKHFICAALRLIISLRITVVLIQWNYITRFQNQG